MIPKGCKKENFFRKRLIYLFSFCAGKREIAEKKA